MRATTKLQRRPFSLLTYRVARRWFIGTDVQRWWPVVIGYRWVAGRSLPSAGTVTVDFLGCRLEIPARDTSMALAAYYGAYEYTMRRVFDQIVVEGARVLDVGANIGLYTVPAATRVAASGHVVAVEPLEQARALLTRNLEANGCENVTVLGVAAGDTSEGLMLRARPGELATHSAVRGGAVEHLVDQAPLDELLPDGQFDVVKIDVEGYEFPVIRGMRGILSRSDPVLFLEHNPNRYTPALATFLAERFSHLWLVDERHDRCRRISPEELISLPAANVIAAARDLGIGDDDPYGSRRGLAVKSLALDAQTITAAPLTRRDRALLLGSKWRALPAVLRSAPGHVQVGRAKITVETISDLGTLQSSLVDAAWTLGDLTQLTGSSRPFVIDVGANIGQFACAVKLLSPDAEVLCFEPDPEVAARLKHNVSGLSDVEVKAAALGPVSGTATLYRHHLSVMSTLVRGLVSDSTEKIDVPLLALDEVIEDDRRVDLLKVDVEGAELDVLRGAVKTLQRTHFLLVEVGLARDEHGATLELLSFVKQLVPSARVVKFGRPLGPKDRPTCQDVLMELHP